MKNIGMKVTFLGCALVVMTFFLKGCYSSSGWSFRVDSEQGETFFTREVQMIGEGTGSTGYNTKINMAVDGNFAETFGLNPFENGSGLTQGVPTKLTFISDADGRRITLDGNWLVTPISQGEEK